LRQAKKSRVSGLLGASALSGAFALTLGAPAHAQQASDPGDPGGVVSEVVVTASRRAQDITEIPYNITAMGSDQVQRTGVATIEDLSRQVPNLVVTSSGAQFLGAQRQIMRGLNASPASRSGVALEQNPVSTYLGNAPFANFFQIEDIERVEVLRGPQGTLYGAGALGGAIRLIPTEPALGLYEARLTASAGLTAHSSDRDYGFNGLINVPIGDTIAIRVGASHEYSGGFIDQYGVWLRAGGHPLGDPVLANPAAPLTSPAAAYDAKDVNYTKSTNWRFAVRWKPNDQLDVTLAHNISRVSGYGPNFDTPSYNGGPDVLAPSVVYPDTGEYEVVQRGISPFARQSEMTTLDASYDLGFATVSSTSSYFETSAETYIDGTWGVLALPAAYLPYYTGSPANPRFNAPQRFNDANDVLTQEIRLVSNGDGAFDYVVGAFYQREENTTLWYGFGPGQTAYNSLPGVTVPAFNPGGADELLFLTGGTQRFTDKALFGELTWHATDQLDLTVGARVFRQTIDRNVLSINPLFGIVEASTNSAKFSDSKFRFNATYEYLDDHRAYVTFSQGFRRGGANAFTLTGFVREPASLLDYQPDSVDNFELGLKGRFANGWLYTADVFLAKWKDPQIGAFTAVNFWPAVFNGKEAESKGFEIELDGELTDTLSFQLGYAYTKAELTESFCVPSGDGSGRPSPVGDIPCAISGLKGAPLPSAPRHSGTATLNYERELSNDDTITATLNANYKGDTRQNLPTAGARYPLVPAYWLVNAYAGWEHGPVTTSLYVRNLLDERVVYSINTRISAYAPIDVYETIGRPRTMGVDVTYRW